MIRYYMTYYCGWWCRGSTHLQMWQQGWTAYSKTSGELWNGEFWWIVWNGNLHGWRVERSNKHSQKQFLHPDHWIWNLKSREHDEHIYFVLRPRIGPVTVSLKQIDRFALNDNSCCIQHNYTYAQLDSQLQNNSTFCLWRSMHRRHMSADQKDMHPFLSDQEFGSIKHHFGSLHTNTFGYQYKPRNVWHSIIHWFNSLYIHHQVYIMDTTHYWLFAREHSIWNASITMLQFWIADLKPQILSDAIEWVYTAFFCSNSAQQLQNLPERNTIQLLCNHIKWHFQKKNSHRKTKVVKAEVTA